MKLNEVSVKALLVIWVILGAIVTLVFAGLNIRASQQLTANLLPLIERISIGRQANRDAVLVVSDYLAVDRANVLAQSQEQSDIPNTSIDRFNTAMEGLKQVGEANSEALSLLDSLESTHREFLELDRQLSTVETRKDRLVTVEAQRVGEIDSSISTILKSSEQLLQAANTVNKKANKRPPINISGSWLSGYNSGNVRNTERPSHSIEYFLSTIADNVLAIYHQAQQARFAKSQEQLTESFEQVVKSAISDGKTGIKELSQLVASNDQYTNSVNQISNSLSKLEQALLSQDDSLLVTRSQIIKLDQQSLQLQQRSRGSAETILSLLDDLAKVIDSIESAWRTEVLKTSHVNKTASSMAAIIAVILFIVASFIFVKRILGPLQQVGEAVNSITGGKFDLNSGDSSSGFSGMLDQIRDIASKLNNMLDKISGASEHIGSTTNMVLESSDQAVEGVQKQINTGKKVVDTISSMVDHAEKSEENALHALSVAQQSTESVSSGVIIVKESVVEINKLSESVNNAADVITELKTESDNISVVLDVIRNIADQTNLLALNAAIEAARAGDNGRGFAVVADEVRSLAKKTQDSTIEIQQLIERIQDQADKAVSAMDVGRTTSEKGVEKITAAGAILEEIEQNIVSIYFKNMQIESSGKEQVDLAKIVHANILLMEHVLKNNCTDIERINDANRALDDVAQELTSLIDGFPTSVSDESE